MLLRFDVVDREVQRMRRLRELAVFAPTFGATPDMTVPQSSKDRCRNYTFSAHSRSLKWNLPSLPP